MTEKDPAIKKDEKREEEILKRMQELEKNMQDLSEKAEMLSVGKESPDTTPATSATEPTKPEPAVATPEPVAKETTETVVETSTPDPTAATPTKKETRGKKIKEEIRNAVGVAGVAAKSAGATLRHAPEAIIGLVKKNRAERAKEKAKQKTAKEAAKNTPAKSPEERVNKFIKEFQLEALLPAEFHNLNEAQKLKVVQDLQKRVVDIVKSDAETQYSDIMKSIAVKPMGIKKLLQSFYGTATKEQLKKDVEVNVFEKIKNTPEGKEIIRKDLQVLVEKNLGRNISVDEKGIAQINFVNPDNLTNPTPEELSIVAEFNTVAKNFAAVPYEWGQEKSGKNKKKYEKAQAEFALARLKILKIKELRESPTEKGKTIIEVMALDNSVRMEQLLTTHPEFEQALSNLSKGPGGRELVKDTWRTMTGNNVKNLLLAVGGYGGRMLARGAATMTSATWVTAVGALAVGGGVGWIRGKWRAKDTLEARKKEARRGTYDESGERVVMADAVELSRLLQKTLTLVNNPVAITKDAEEIEFDSKPGTKFKREKKEINAEENRARALSRLTARIEHTRGLIEKGRVNFGGAKEALGNEFGLVNDLNNAIATLQVYSGSENKDVKARIDRLVATVGKEISESTAGAQNKFIRQQAKQGAIIGLSFAGAGYAVRWFGEVRGWWGQHAENTAGVKADTDAGFVERTKKWFAGLFGDDEKLPPPEQHDMATKFTRDPDVMDSSPETLDGNTQPLPKIRSGAELMKNLPGTLPEEIDSDAIIGKGEGVVFEKGKGAIQGIIDLRKQLEGVYHKDFSNAPQGIQDFMKEPNAAKQAINLGLFDPDKAKESAMIHEGAVLKFDKDGNLLFGKPDASGNIPKFSETKWGMFDSDKSGVAGAEKITDMPETAGEERSLLHDELEKSFAKDLGEINTGGAEDVHGSSGEISGDESWRGGDHVETATSQEEKISSAREALEKHYHNEALREGIDKNVPRVQGYGTPPQPGYEPPYHGPRVDGYGMAPQPWRYYQGFGRISHWQEGPSYRYGFSPDRGYLYWYNDLPPELNNELSFHSEYSHPDYNLNLNGEQVYTAYTAGKADIEWLFGNEHSPAWHNLSEQSATKLLENTTAAAGTPEGKLASYMRALREYADTQPERRWLGLKKESTRDYIARAIKKLVYIGKLDEFKAAVRP